MRIEVQNLWASTLTNNFIFKVINKVFPKVNHSGATDTAEHERKWRPVTEQAERIRTGAFHPLYSHPCPQSYGKPTEHLKCARYMLGTNPTQPELCWVHTGYQSYSTWAGLAARWVPILTQLNSLSMTETGSQVLISQMMKKQTKTETKRVYRACTEKCFSSKMWEVKPALWLDRSRLAPIKKSGIGKLL